MLSHLTIIWGFQLCHREAWKINILLLLLKPASRIIIHPLSNTKELSVLPKQVQMPLLCKLLLGCKHAKSDIWELLITCAIIVTIIVIGCHSHLNFGEPSPCLTIMKITFPGPIGSTRGQKHKECTELDEQKVSVEAYVFSDHSSVLPAWGTMSVSPNLSKLQFLGRET